MLKPECLNPEEVLNHLNSLGYHDITPQQLKEFIHDLKKLIKYDQKQASQNFKESPPSKIYSYGCDCSCTQSENSCDKLSSNGSYDSSLVSEYSTSDTCDKDDSKFHVLNKQNNFNVPENEKVQSSFIRPWHLPVHNNFSKRSRKNLDPVRLYHQYKELWNQYNIPGESKHSQLRWMIRNRMLGQEPQPRVTF